MKPVPIEVAAAHARDPHADVAHYNVSFEVQFAGLNELCAESALAEIADLDAAGCSRFASRQLYALSRRLVWMYARGDALGELQEHLGDDLAFLQALQIKLLPPPANAQAPVCDWMGACSREHLQHMALVLMLVPDPSAIRAWVAAQDTDDMWRRFEVDVLLQAFVPGQIRIPKKYKKPINGSHGHDALWATLFRALAEPDTASRSRAMAAYMSQWGRLMKPVGWKPIRRYCALAPDGRQADPSCRGDSLFVDFAFEAALAVCAWDLDDSAFSHHLYYPRDLVQHYRAQVRHTRDAWRAEGVGPGLAIKAPPPPPKADLSKSKLKALPRWLELVCDGDAVAVAAVLEACGRPRNLKKGFGDVLLALSENGQAVCADIKDAATLEGQLDNLLSARGLQNFEAPSEPLEGPARCEQVLQALGLWLRSQAYALVQPRESNGDSWQGWLVSRAYLDEFENLSDELCCPISVVSASGR